MPLMCSAVLHSIHSRSYITVVIWNALHTFIHFFTFITYLTWFHSFHTYYLYTIARDWGRSSYLHISRHISPIPVLGFQKIINLYCHVWQDLLHAPTRCHTPILYSGDRVYDANLEGPPMRRNLWTINQCTSNGLYSHIVQGRQCRKG